MRLTAMFVGFLYGALALWSAVSIFVLGEYDTKFGGPVANFFLGLQWGALMTLAVGLGYLLPAALVTRTGGGLTRRTTLFAAAGALAALGIMSTGVVGELSNVLPLGTIGGLVVAFVTCGGVVGSISMAVRHLLGYPRRPGQPREYS